MGAPGLARIPRRIKAGGLNGRKKRDPRGLDTMKGESRNQRTTGVERERRRNGVGSEKPRIPRRKKSKMRKCRCVKR